jgi:DNA-binding NtrC family response regulator
MLDRSAILVTEDEPLIALDLVLAIEEADGTVVGPTSTVREALALIEQQPIAAAILDVNLIDGDISPVVERLMEHNVPIILQSGVGAPPPLIARFPDLLVRIKPNLARELVAETAHFLDVRRN